MTSEPDDEPDRPPETVADLGLASAAILGTPMGVEAARLEAGEPWCTSQIAGLQFYDYGRRDDVIGEVMPKVGDRLALMRRPENPADPRAVEVWWRDGHLLGHLPRCLAAALAPGIDAGEPCRAYVWDAGDGSRWSLRALLVGAAVEPEHRRNWERREAREVEEASMEAWGRPECRLVPYRGRHMMREEARPSADAPTPRQAAAAEAWQARQDAAARRRQRDAAAAFSGLPLALPPGAAGPTDDALRGHVFTWWDQVPGWLRTRTQLAELGLRPGAAAFASIGYGRGSRTRRYDLYAVPEAAPMRASARQVYRVDSC